MSGAHLLVTFDDLSDMANRLSTEGEAIGTQLTRLLDEVRVLVESGWQGQTAVAFESLYTVATESWREVETALVGMSGLVRNIAGQYQEQEDALTSMLNA